MPSVSVFDRITQGDRILAHLSKTVNPSKEVVRHKAITQVGFFLSKLLGVLYMQHRPYEWRALQCPAAARDVVPVSQSAAHEHRTSCES